MNEVDCIELTYEDPTGLMEDEDMCQSDDAPTIDVDELIRCFEAGAEAGWSDEPGELCWSAIA